MPRRGNKRAAWMLPYRWAILSRLRPVQPDYDTRHCNRGCPFNPPCDPTRQLRCELSDEDVEINARVPQYDTYQHYWGPTLRERDDPLYDLEREKA